MNLKGRCVLVNRAAVGVVLRGVVNVVKRFARHSDDVRVNDLENLVRFDAKRKFRIGPTENRLTNFAPPGANRNFDANPGRFLSGRVFQGNVNVAVGLDSHINNAARERIPFLFNRQPCFRFSRQRNFRPWPLPSVNIRGRHFLDCRLIPRNRRRVRFRFPPVNAMLALRGAGRNERDCRDDFFGWLAECAAEGEDQKKGNEFGRGVHTATDNILAGGGEAFCFENREAPLCDFYPLPHCARAVKHIGLE